VLEREKLNIAERKEGVILGPDSGGGDQRCTCLGAMPGLILQCIIRGCW
jgi:hypothetical protein